MRRWLVALVLLGACSSGSKSATTTTSTTADQTTTTTTIATTEPVTAAPLPIEMGRWKGSVDTDTGNISPVDTWEIHWGPVGGAGLLIVWYDPSGSIAGHVAVPSGPAGMTTIRTGGTFYLHIGRYGTSYEVWAVDVPG